MLRYLLVTYLKFALSSCFGEHIRYSLNSRFFFFRKRRKQEGAKAEGRKKKRIGLILKNRVALANMVTLTLLYLLVLGVTCLMAMPIHRDSLSEGHGLDATDSYSRDDETIEDGMTEEDSPSENHELMVCFPRFVFILIITALSCKRLY